MRNVILAVGAIVFSCVVAGCEGGGESQVTPAEQQSNPNVGQDALKKMGPMPTTKHLPGTGGVPK